MLGSLGLPPFTDSDAERPVGTRIFQDTDFKVEGFSGRPLKRLVGVVDSGEPEDQPYVLFLMSQGSERWNSCFLDAVLAFWEAGYEPSDHFDGECIGIDYLQRYDLSKQVIREIRCVSCEIRFHFESGDTLILRRSAAPDSVTGSEVALIKGV